MGDFRGEQLESEDVLWIAANRVLAREARLIDQRDWDAWLQLYRPDAEYWVPAWTDEGVPTDDPNKQLSLIYYENRAGLEDRVFRIRTGRSAATMPAMRTCHMFTLVDVEASDRGIRARSSWTVHSYREGAVLTYFGWAEYLLVPEGASYQIARKKTWVLNDIADVVLDIYSI